MASPLSRRTPPCRLLLACRRLLLACCLTVCPGSMVFAQPPDTGQPEFNDQQLEFFESRIRPLLVEHCFQCHGPDSEYLEGGLALNSRAAILRGGDSGPAIDLESPGESLLLSAVEYGDLFQMPPDSRLPDDQVEWLRRWIRDGAAWPAEEAGTPVPAGEEFDLQARRDAHWCWKNVTIPPRPETHDQDWALDPLDRFIWRKLQEHGLSPAPPAERATWLRRVTFDLTGLPPTETEIRNFLNDDSEQAWARVVDRLLASPRFGERWARHWMDLIRYAETCGHEFDYPIPHAWHYRDYLIRALNEDVRYDDFVVEHIAGDLHPLPRLNPDSQTNESVLGTGFWFLGEATHGPVDVKGDEAGRIDNQIDVMSKTFLGLTVACARCHDHKFDAISTADYYGMSGFLQSSRRQDVMLDPDRKIGKAFEAAGRAAAEASQAIREVLNSPDVPTHPPDRVRLACAAIDLLQAHPDWQAPARLAMEAESLPISGKTAGQARRQDLAGWSGGGQLWWSGGKPEDELELEFEVPGGGRYRISARFTRAPDYGIVAVRVNDDPARSQLDLYAEKVERSEEIELGEFELEAGPQRLQLRITGKNAAAIDAYMAGVDELILYGNPSGFEGWRERQQARIDEAADRLNLDRSQLVNWMRAISDRAASGMEHPLYLAHRIARTGLDAGSTDSDGQVRQWLEEIRSREQAWRDWLEDSRLFADRFADWPSEGFAFEGNRMEDQATGRGDDRWLNVSDPNPVGNWRETAPHSGFSGGKFEGVMRSPTFEITHPQIHYRIAARKARIRLVVDGFRMDQYNPLLFGGMIMPVDTDGQWQWVSQAGDLKNYIGHRAFIEIIDQGDGFVSVDQVRFADRGPPATRPIVPWIPAGPSPPASAQPESGQSTDQPGSPSLFQQLMSSGFTGGQSGQPARESLAKLPPELLNLYLRYRLIPGIDYEALDRAIATARDRIAQINDGTPAPTLAIGMTEGSPENEHVFIRGNHRNIGDEVPRGPITALRDPDDWKISPGTSGRWDLAMHMIDLDHPLTRRVMVNRIWHHLTGRGIVASVDNFGVLGDAPTHPELLDYLAVEFAEADWSIKALIRRIVLSQTYRMASTASPEAMEIDPANQWLHHFRVRRLQGEAIRDSMLSISGQLDETMYGPPVPIHLTGFMQGRGRPGQSGPLDGNGRRSVYLEIRRNFLSPMMLAFDTPIPFNTIGRRTRSNVPAQALILMNDPFVAQQARHWATRLLAAGGDGESRVRSMYRDALGRQASEEEVERGLEFVKNQTALLQEAGEPDSELQAWADLCHVVFNLKDFIFVR